MSVEEHGQLSDEDREILDFERNWSGKRGDKKAAIFERFGLAPATYYRRRAKLVVRAEAAAYAPVLVRQLRG